MMKKRICAVVQDLLILYEDDLLQRESKEMIEDHIKECAECRKFYKASKSKIVIDDTPDVKEQGVADSMKKFARRVAFKHVMIIAVILCMILVFDTVFRAFTVHNGGVRAAFLSMSTDDFNVKEMYQLQNGDIYIVFQSDQEFSVKYMSSMDVPHEELNTDSENGYYNVHFEKISSINKALTAALGFYEIGIVYPVEDYIALDGELFTRECARIDYVENFEGNKVALWEKGQELPKAPLEVEKELIKEYFERGYIEKAWEAIHDLEIAEESRQEIETYYEQLFDESLSKDVFAGTYVPMIVYEKLGELG